MITKMKKYRSKIKSVEAIQFLGDNLGEVSQFIGISKEEIFHNDLSQKKSPKCINANTGFCIPTQDGLKRVMPNDYITKDEKMELDSYSDEEFASLFEVEASHVFSTKEQLQEKLSELRYAYEQVHSDIEWAGLTESYRKASAVYREIEDIEKLINSL